MRRIASLLAACTLIAACNTTSSKIAFSREEYRLKKESVLYVYRARAFVGSGLETVIFFDGKSIGILRQNGYYPIHALAGTHKLKGCSASLVAAEACREISIDMPANDFTIMQLMMELHPEGPRATFIKAGDLAVLTDSKNEGNYHDAPLRDLLPKSEKKVVLTAATLGQDNSKQTVTPLNVAFLDFIDQTDGQVYSWLSGSLPDAIDQSMRKDFEYKRQQTEVGANLVISGSYVMAGKDTIRIQAKIYYRDGNKVLGTESVDSPVTAEIFNATKILSDRLVAKFHAMVKK